MRREVQELGSSAIDPAGKPALSRWLEFVMRASGTIAGFSSKFPRAIRRHGFFGAFGVAIGQATDLASRLRPSVRSETLRSKQRARDFDQRFGVDTAGYIHPTALTLRHPNKVHAVSYGASDPEDFKSGIASLPINYSDFVFVDFGSGKGRAILLASEFPFRRVIGVEFSEELHKIAQNNIRHFLRNAANCTDVESVCLDAVDYLLPDDNLICYFCNPFDAILMTQMVAKIQDSLLRKPRDIFILYYNAKEGHVFDRADCFKRVETNGWIRVWRSTHEAEKIQNGLC